MKHAHVEIICPHCQSHNDIVSGPGNEDFNDVKNAPGIVVVMLCFTCCGVFRFRYGIPEVISPEEWLEFPAEMRGEIQHQIKLLKRVKEMKEAEEKARWN